MTAQRPCAKCAHVNTGDARFCARCGFALESETRPIAAPSPTTKPVANTIFGMPAASPPEPSTAPTALESAESPIKTIEMKRMNRTIMGMPAASGSAQPATAPAASGSTASRVPETPPVVTPPPQKANKPIGPTHRTMLGVTAPSGPTPTTSPQHLAGEPTGEMSIAGLTSPTRRRERGLLALLVLGLLTMSCVVAGLLYWRFARTPSLHASIVADESGEAIEFVIPSAGDGAVARFAGATQPVTGGHVRFPVPAGVLHIGDNRLSVEVLRNGEATRHEVTLSLELRVRADLATLSSNPSGITIVVEALPGSRASLDGQELPLDAAGRGSRVYPVETLSAEGRADGTAALIVRWSITPPGGAAEEGALTTRVPLSALQLERPGMSVTTDREAIDIAGTVAPQSLLTIDGQPVVASEGRFIHRFRLPHEGTYDVAVTARSPGRAPRTLTLHIRKVADLAREAASFEVDSSLSYARVAAAPAQFVGQRAAFEGRVYNVDVQNGRSAVQMLVRDCPAEQRCPLWVTYPAATEITVGSWARVLGTIAGEQQFRSESGQVRSVPRLDAAFVLPTHP